MLKIGTDFSGIGAPEQALKKLGIEYKSVFACDIDKYAKQSFLAIYNTDNWYDDIMWVKIGHCGIVIFQ